MPIRLKNQTKYKQEKIIIGSEYKITGNNAL